MYISRACGARWTTNSSQSWVECAAAWVSCFPRMTADGVISINLADTADLPLCVLALCCSRVVRGINFDISLAEFATGTGFESGPRPGNSGELDCPYARRPHYREHRRSGRRSFA